MALYIARHGQTDWNKARRYQARTDVPINVTGRQQAQALKELFASLNLNFVHAVCSPLGRALETATIALEGSSVVAVVEPLLMEIDLGDWEGRYGDDLEEEFGEQYTSWSRDCYPTAAPGGESIFDVVERVRDVVQPLALRASDADVLIVAHQATNIAIKAAVSGVADVDRLRQYRQANDEVDVWHPRENRFSDRLYARDSGSSA